MATSKVKSTLSETLECPVCLDLLEIPIRQCVVGHSFCTKCIRPDITCCPQCRGQIQATRNYKLEELLQTINLPCANQKAGCTYMLSREMLKAHEGQCNHRRFKCEGKVFCNWDCNWEGFELLEHFKRKHVGHTTMEFNTLVSIPYDSTKDFTDIQLISAHYQLFWYKHQIDVANGKALWIFQFLGPKNVASQYYYEFEFFNAKQPIRKFKMTEHCESDTKDFKDIVDSGKCVEISLKTLKTYVDDKNEYSFRFRIMKIRKDDGRSKIATIDAANIYVSFANAHIFTTDRMPEIYQGLPLQKPFRK